MKILVYTCDKQGSGGLNDRFKGIVSSYILALATKRKFLINWKYPCNISKALLPNLVNWECNINIQKQIVSKNCDKVLIIDKFTDTFANIFFKQDPNQFYAKQILTISTNILFVQELKNNPFLAHNLRYFKNKSSEKIFQESINILFQPDHELQEDIKNLRKKSTNFFLGIHVRLGGNYTNWPDLKFYQGDYENLRQKIFDKCREYIVKHAKNIDFLLCTDNEIFKHDFINTFANYKIITSPHAIFHIDRSQPKPDEVIPGFRKAVLDFYLLGECDEILITFGEYAKFAAYRTNKKTIQIINEN